MGPAPCERFRPARIEGASGVDEVAVFADRLELSGQRRTWTLAFKDLARWPRPAWFWKLAFALGWRRPWLPVADRDWFHPEGEKYFRFHASPPLTICIPAESDDLALDEKLFLRVQFLISSGGYDTFDLG